MAVKGEKLSAETRANMSAAQKARWRQIHADREAAAIHAAEPNCKRNFYQRFMAWLEGK